ncbi:MAG TPA: hypothetical protein VHH35_20975, partial [Pyrinomonadaceae bacterium]|nr:hypothetical protein [Pyrinomonadaceae bacterium]
MSEAHAQWTTNGNDISNSNSGNVGVKTTTPEFPLQVNNTTTNVLGLVYTGSMGTTSGSGIHAMTSTGSSAADQRLGFLTFGTRSSGTSYTPIAIEGFSSQAWTLGSAQGAYLTFSTTTNGSATRTERMRIGHNGNVGIGTTNPADTLHVFSTSGVGTLRLQGGNQVAGFVSVWDFGPMLILSNNRNPLTAENFKTTAAGAQILIGAELAAGDIGFYTTSTGTTPTHTELVRMKANGRVGIGTITPGYQLDVQGGSINSSAGLCIAGDCKSAWSQVGGSQWTTSGSTINYATGNVGIGVASPTAKLDVNGIVDATGFTINGTTLTGSQWATSGSTINYATGNVGIGVASPTTKLDVDGVVDATGFTVNGTAVTSSQWATTGSTINYSGGNVGVGTASPTSKLHVTGTGRFTGDLTVDGNIAAKYQDLAEWVPAAEQIAAGTVVVLDSSKSNQVISSSKSYDTRVAGVISAQPGIMLGEKGDNKVLVATTGRVLVNV